MIERSLPFEPEEPIGVRTFRAVYHAIYKDGTISRVGLLILRAIRFWAFFGLARTTPDSADVVAASRAVLRIVAVLG